MSTDRKTPPPPIPARIWKIAAVTGAGAFMAMLDSTVVNLALETIRADFGASLSLIQWIATVYLIALAISLPAAAFLGNRFGYGRLWAGSLAGFVAASVLCAVAPGPLSLIGARFLQGLAGGLMVPAGQAVIGAAAGPKQLGRIMGALGLVVALGPAIGPALGGLLLDHASWRWLFWINVPVGVAALILARGLVPGGERDDTRRLDVRGLFLLGAGLPLLLYGATEIGAEGAGARNLLVVAAGLLLAAGFVLGARRSQQPLIDLGLLRRPVFATATAITGLTGINMYGGLLLLPLYLQVVAGRDTVETGFLLLAMGLGSALALPVGGMLTDRFGAGRVSFAGVLALLVSTVPFLLPSPPAAALLAPVLVLRGVGMALGQMPAMSAAYAAARKSEMGDAATLVNIVQRLGGAIGAVGVVVVLAQGHDAAGYVWAFALLAAVSALTMVLAMALTRRARMAEREPAAG
ncbi:DHA2 family efflux MFS transporter permease subunit [Nitratireductor pacificus]|uniref:Major facilitator superfamily transporter n=1 Tax=Nitratireductor pacificus pht-3B TaxID=391937 RepID=K2MJ67_9HYPH|nr:DHA2 family efflux MFS transporter permease subunit [Nitratireductor pacificus]EKF17192.1 major facilitator superfamily transporter [Nitratireductor pacificus pht-3B]